MCTVMIFKSSDDAVLESVHKESKAQQANIDRVIPNLMGQFVLHPNCSDKLFEAGNVDCLTVT